MARILAFRAPINVSSARVGTTVGDPGGDLGTATPATPPKAAPAPESLLNRVGGHSFPTEVAAATVAGGAVGLFFGGWFWGALGLLGSNLAGRFAGAAYCRNTSNPSGYAAGKCQGGYGGAQVDPLK